MHNPSDQDTFGFVLSVVIGLFSVILLIKGILGPRASRTPKASRAARQGDGGWRRVVGVAGWTCAVVALSSASLLLFLAFANLFGEDWLSRFGSTLVMVGTCSALITLALFGIRASREIANWFMTKPTTRIERLYCVAFGLFGLGQAGTMESVSPYLPYGLYVIAGIVFLAGLLTICVTYLGTLRHLADARGRYRRERSH
jgi:hypothetical protein